MHGRPILIAFALLAAAGCVAPGAQLQTASVAEALAGLGSAIPGATSTVLPNGDLLLTLEGETDRALEFEFAVPEGVTFVETHVTSEDAPFGLSLFNADTRSPLCYPRTWTGWNQRASNEVTCTAVAASDPASTWTLRATPGIAGSLVDVPTVGPFVAVMPASYALHVIFSTQPLDGAAAVLKLDALSRPVYDAMEIEMLDVPSSADGVELHVELTRPKTDENVPIMLRASPYNGPAQNSEGRSSGAFVDYWVARGYATAVMDLRGTGKSDGCFSMRGLIDELDIATVVDFLGEQDWSNGKVGMSGVSYVGYTPVAAAVQAPEHLAAIWIAAPAIDTWSNYLPGGAQTGRSFSTVLAYTSGNAALTPADEMPPDAVLHTVDAFCEPTIFPSANDPRNLYDAWYAERNLTERLGDIIAPVYYEHGFWDNNVKANAAVDFFNALTVEKRGVFGSWQHIPALRADQQVRVLAWFDHWLKGIDTGILETPTMEVLTNTREWRSGDAWPPMDATYVDFPLEGADFVAPVTPFASVAPVQGAPTRFTRETEPFADKLYLSGVPLLELDVALVNGGNAHVEARIYEVPAEGEPIFAGVGWFNLAHRNGHDTFAPFAPGESAVVTLKFLPQDHVFQAGSTLFIEIAGVTDDWGGPETGVGGTPTVVSVASATLRLPTLPVSTLAPAPRSAS